MIYSEYEMLCKMFLSRKLAAEPHKVTTITFNKLGRGVVGITLTSGEHSTFTDYTKARDWCLSKEIKHL